MKQILILSAFGVLGVLCRHFINLAGAKYLSTSFPLHTLAINVLGSLAIGVAYVLMSENSSFSPELRLGFVTGFLGGFTTFSAFSLESVRLLETGHMKLAVINIIASPVLGLSACSLGLFVTRTLTRS